MNVRLKKEFQSLFWPWFFAALMGLFPLLVRPLQVLDWMPSQSKIFYLASSTYVIGVVILAAMLFGNEFQQNTISLLFSQPRSRSAIWWDKLGVTSFAVLSLTFFHLAGGSINIGALHSHYWHLFWLLPFLLSAAMYWSLLTRSVLGGAVLSLVSLAALYLVAWLIQDEFLYLYRLSLDLAKINVLLTRMSLILTPVCFWLSWLRLQNLEIPGNWNDEAGIANSSVNSRKSIIDFKSHAGRPIFNLILKELRLLRPVLLIALLFSILWLAAAAGLALRPRNPDLPAALINGLCGVYIPLVIFLSGAISFGEEKRLGIHAFNLSSPISSKIQFSIKNLITTLTALCCTALLIPLLAKITGPSPDIYALKFFSGPLMGSVLVAGAMVAGLVQIGIWAGTVADRTIHAFFLAVAAVAGFYALFFFAASTPSPPILHALQEPLYSLIARCQLSHIFIAEWLWLLILGSFILSFVSFILPSWKCFHRINGEQQNIKTALLLPCFAVGLTGLLAGALVGCLSLENFQASSLYQETRNSLLSLHAETNNSVGPSSKIFTLTELAATGKLSPRTQAWLHNSTTKVNYHPTSNGKTYSMALVLFPNSIWIQPIALNSQAVEDLSSLEDFIRENHKQQKLKEQP